MFCVAAEIPLHGLSSSFLFSFSLAILLLSNQLAHAGRRLHHPAPPPTPRLWGGSLGYHHSPVSLPGEGRKDAAPWLSSPAPRRMSSSEVQMLGFVGFEWETSVFSVRAHN